MSPEQTGKKPQSLFKDQTFQLRTKHRSYSFAKRKRTLRFQEKCQHINTTSKMEIGGMGRYQTGGRGVKGTFDSSKF